MFPNLATLIAAYLNFLLRELPRGDYSTTSTLLIAHVVPLLGHLPLTDIDEGHVRDVLDTMTDQGFADDVVELCGWSLAGALLYAEEQGEIPCNPVAHLLEGGRLGVLL